MDSRVNQQIVPWHEPLAGLIRVCVIRIYYIHGRLRAFKVGAAAHLRLPHDYLTLAYNPYKTTNIAIIINV